mgnify:CR=1 FL=1
MNVSWRAGAWPLFTTVAVYAQQSAAVFTQDLPLGAPDTQASQAQPGEDRGEYPPCVAFPAFALDGPARLPELGFATWKGVMSNFELGHNVTSGLYGLFGNGPVAVFDAAGATVVVSPLDDFKLSVHTARPGPAPAWETGVTSEVRSLPRGFRHRTLLVAGAGVTATMVAWGQALQGVHHTSRASVAADALLSHVSYWTDNGAYYYGPAWNETGGGGREAGQASLEAVMAGLRQQGIQPATVQLDDWWYPTVPLPVPAVPCVFNWTTWNTTGFGTTTLKQLAAALGSPGMVLYVPNFCRDNVYRRAGYAFVNGSVGERVFALPAPATAYEFYGMLFDYGQQAGMSNFEMDFMDDNFLAVPDFRTEYGAAATHLSALDRAAAERGIAVQVCMTLPSDLMHSVTTRSITNYRASGDYPGHGQWNVGGSGLLAFALGLRPSKDTFWTHRPASAVATGQPYPLDANPGSNCEFNVLVALLSGGPFGLSDKAGDTNATLVQRAARQDGRLLQADRPATVLEYEFARAVPNSTRPAPEGSFWGTSTTVGGATWHHVVSINQVSAPYQLLPSDLYPAPAATARWVARPFFDGFVPRACTAGAAALASKCITAGPSAAADLPPLQNTRPIMVQNDTVAFDLTLYAPVLDHGWVLLGEIAKYVPVSRARVAAVNATAAMLTVDLLGAAHEPVTLVALEPPALTVRAVTLTCSAAGTATARFVSQADST